MKILIIDPAAVSESKITGSGKGGEEILNNITCASNRANSGHKDVTQSVTNFSKTETQNYAPAIPLWGIDPKELKAQF